MDLLASIIQSTLIYSTPIMIAAIGAMYSEKSGVTNIALEGLMMIGAFSAATAIVFIEPFTSYAPWISLIFAIIFGTIVSLLHAYLSINLSSNQIISATSINIFAGGITIYLAEIIFKQQRTIAFLNGFRKTSIPYLKDIPILGSLFFSQIYTTVYISFIIVIISWYILYKTPFGLRLRGAGENPHAIDSLGLNVYKIRYIGVLISGALAGLAGGIMVLTQNTQYSITTVHGTGFIALAALIFGGWNPFGVMLTSLFFGFAQILSLYSVSISERWNLKILEKLPEDFYFALPYILTIIALILFSRNAKAPKAVGEIYEKDKR